MEFLSSIFVGKYQNILLVAIIFFFAYLMLRFVFKDTALNSRPLLTLSVIWAIYTVWEFIVQIFSPEANIRIDLLIIWPVVGVLTVWKLFRVFR